VYVAAQRGSSPVAPDDVADLLNRSPVSVTEMYKRLADRNLLECEPYQGAELTETGRKRAHELHKSYVTLSWFSKTVLYLDNYEREAMAMANVVSKDVAARLAETLFAEHDLDGQLVGLKSDDTEP